MRLHVELDYIRGIEHDAFYMYFHMALSMRKVTVKTLAKIHGMLGAKITYVVQEIINYPHRAMLCPAAVQYLRTTQPTAALHAVLQYYDTYHRDDLTSVEAPVDLQCAITFDAVTIYQAHPTLHTVTTHVQALIAKARKISARWQPTDVTSDEVYEYITAAREHFKKHANVRQDFVSRMSPAAWNMLWVQFAHTGFDDMYDNYLVALQQFWPELVIHLTDKTWQECESQVMAYLRNVNGVYITRYYIETIKVLDNIVAARPALLSLPPPTEYFSTHMATYMCRRRQAPCPNYWTYRLGEHNMSTLGLPGKGKLILVCSTMQKYILDTGPSYVLVRKYVDDTAPTYELKPLTFKVKISGEAGTRRVKEFYAQPHSFYGLTLGSVEIYTVVITYVDTRDAAMLDPAIPIL